jgi:hypothetical protein
VSGPCISHALIFAPTDECFATAALFKTLFGLGGGMLRNHRSRHCEEPTGRANARPMTGSATKQSILPLLGAVRAVIGFVTACAREDRIRLRG